ncbi:hypothetical protein KKA95_03095 [Patescibacteria group bacterium]|nr:hypothetical protein [Patescibacteria group bacterium]
MTASQVVVINAMKLKKVLIIVLSFVLIGIHIPTGYSEGEELTEPQKECEDKKPDFLEKNEEGIFVLIKTLEDEITAGTTKLNIDTLNEKFEDAQNKYHKYIQCIFDYSENRVLEKLIKPDGEYPSAEETCGIDVVSIIGDTNPDQMLTPLLNTYNIYSEYLDELGYIYLRSGRVDSGEGGENLYNALQQYNILSASFDEFNRKISSEKANALVAMDITFVTLKELRLAFVMHNHFQCMLFNLEKYRNFLGKIRTLVEGLPGKLKDASMTK